MHPDPSQRHSHDILLIAAHAAGDLSTTETIRAHRVIASCPECALLLDDLTALRAATRALAGWTRVAPRTFALSPLQAERLGRGSWWRTLLRPFASPRGTSRPLALAFSSFGLAGLLAVALLPGLLGGSPASLSGSGRDLATSGGAQGTLAPAVGPGVQSGEQGGGTAVKGADGTPAPEFNAGGAPAPGDATRLAGPLPGPQALLALVSAVLLAVGIGLFALRLLARRLA